MFHFEGHSKCNWYHIHSRHKTKLVLVCHTYNEMNGTTLRVGKKEKQIDR